jgi:hypothetical protein
MKIVGLIISFALKDGVIVDLARPLRTTQEKSRSRLIKKTLLPQEKRHLRLKKISVFGLEKGDRL